ncbi:MAG: hypothetical protein ACKOI2_13735 [Actinomycetota bacterium]
MNLVLTIAVVGGALALIAVLINRRARVADDSVAEFRRQLGALSPDASRPVIRPQHLTERRSVDSKDQSDGDDGTVSEEDEHGS